MQAYLNRLSTGGDGIPQPPARSNGDGIMPTDDQSSSNSANQTPRQNRPEEAPLVRRCSIVNAQDIVDMATPFQCWRLCVPPVLALYTP